MRQERNRRDELLEKTAAAFLEAFGTPRAKVVEGAQPQDIEGWDSLGHARLTTCLEKQFGLTLEIDDLMAMENVTAILDILEARIAAQGSA